VVITVGINILVDVRADAPSFPLAVAVNNSVWMGGAGVFDGARVEIAPGLDECQKKGFNHCRLSFSQPDLVESPVVVGINGPITGIPPVILSSVIDGRNNKYANEPLTIMPTNTPNVAPRNLNMIPALACLHFH
jgi:hypothetical protein